MSQELINSTEMREDVTKRTACMKVFEHADHSFTAAIYGTPVHYMRDGRWEEIDNRLEAAEDEPPSDEDEIESEEGEESIAMQSADSGDAETGVKVHALDPAADGESAGEDTGSGDVANIAGSFRVRLSNKVKKKNMVRLGEGDTKLTWGFVDARSVKRQILKSADDAMNAHAGNTDPTAAYEVPHLESRVRYPEAFEGVDIRYTIGPDRLKEDLVLKHAEAVKSFTWRYAPGELRARQDGADVVFEDAEGMEAYRLSAPYMEDAAGSISRGLTLTLTDDGGKKNKEAYVRLEADGEWLGAEDRAYPVTIDPVVSTPVDRDKIRDCHVSSYYHGDNFYNSHLLKTGRVDGSTLRSYMKFELPYINRADQMITSAWLWLTKYAGSGSAARYIDVHKVTGSWDHKTLTWDNRPGYDEQVIDYAVYQTDGQDTQGFDITNLVKDWYMNGKNYGLMVKDHTETGHYTEYASADIHEDFASLRPHILIQYVNYSGLEGFWTYHSQSAGRAGTIHINDYTGNLILEHETFSLGGSRLPVGLSHVYNSSEAGGKDLGYGRGFRLDCHQTIARREIGDTVYYAHTEGDGTVHYFAKDDKGEWKDELGLGQKLTFAEGDSEARYTITDKSGTKLCFAEKTGLLTKITDANNNTQRITWSGGKVTKVTDPTSRAVALVYDSSGHLVTVKTPSGQEKRFAYDSSGHLTGITDEDGAQSTYTYDGNHMLKGITDPYGYHLYVNWVRPEAYGAWRVSAVLEKAGGEEGMRLGLDYGYNRTKFTDEKGRSQYYLFDNSGHTVSVRDDNGYGAAWEFASRKVSRLSAASDLQFTPVQRLKGTFDGLRGWNGYGSSSAVKVDEETDDDIVFVNKKCIRFTSSDASAYGTVVQTVMLPAGRTYVFSVYGRAAVTGLGEKPSFWLQAQKEDQTEIARHTENIRGNRGWKRMQLVFKIPSGSTPVKTRIVVRAVDMKGTMWLDGFQLEEGEAASRFNLMTNVDFSNGLDGFKKAGNAGDLDRVVTLSVDSGMYPPSKSGLGRNVFMAVGGPSENKRLVYELDISGNAGDCYMASAWGRGQSVPRTVPDTDKDRKDRHFGLCINFYDGEAAAAGKNGNSYQYLEFGADTDSWQYLNGAAVAKQKYTKIQVMYLYNRNANRAYFTGLSFFKERYGNTFVYDDEGNIVRATDKAKKTSSFEYDSSNNMKKLIDAKGKAFKYDYDSRHNVTKAKSDANMCYTFVYDTYGNPLTARTVNPAAETDAKKAMTSKATYTTGTAAGQYMATQTVPERTKSSYDWDVNKGLLKSVSVGGRQTAYSYDSVGRLTKVSGKAHVGGVETQVQVQYGYEKDRLAKITHNGFDYAFTYDGFGNRKSVKIAGTEAVSHTYGDRNGQLLKSTYANGWEVAYTYDSMDRVTQVKAVKGSSSYVIGQYLYDRQGRVARFIDGQVPGKSCTYGYDLTDRLCEAVFDDGTAYTYTYDANDCLVKEHHTLPGGSRDVIRAYDKDNRETSVTCGSAKVEKAFDELGRLSTIKRNGGKHTTTYTYETASDGGQTGRVKTVKNGSHSENYTYDIWGNVTKVTENSSQTGKAYAYDAQGQLIREYDPDKKVWLGYKYDAGGNLTEVRSYPAAEGGSPEGEGTVIKKFAYGTAWKDQLAAMTVEGTTRKFTYDANGNLLSDGKYTYSWTKGSLLAKVTGDSLEATYTYDASGIRTSKTVNGVKTEYLTAGGSILAEKKNGKWQQYLYDGSGQLMAIRYKGADYYYIRDGLMCITGLVDANGGAVVNYRYDSWGKLISITGSMAGTLGKDNPYRYKGYYYDDETGMYYLKSRYYQPEICRFISADVYIATELNMNGSNMYSYCKNNPVMLMDSDGSFAILAIAGAFLAEKATSMIVGAVVNVATTAITAGILGEEYTLKDAVMAAVTGAVGASGPAGPLAAGLISGFVTYACSKEQGESGKTSLTNAVISGAFTLGSTGSLATLLTSSSLIKTATEVEIKLSTSVAIGATCDFGYNLMSAGVSKAYNGAVHASKKGKINIQAYAIASAIQAAVYTARSMRKTQNNRRKQGWIDLEGIKKRRTYN